jgi:hypothetical protein
MTAVTVKTPFRDNSAPTRKKMLSNSEQATQMLRAEHAAQRDQIVSTNWRKAPKPIR